ncbi:MAG: hypothetical protein M3O78_06080 [Chloroflexota bacterium]|nr:hypothetical protein [Chloroflexota bacterium]
MHPSSWEHEGQIGSTDQQFDVSLMCDDLDDLGTSYRPRAMALQVQDVSRYRPD